MQAVVPEDIKIEPGVRPVQIRVDAIRSRACNEGLLGALLTGLMVLLFLRDWRSAADRDH